MKIGRGLSTRISIWVDVFLDCAMSFTYMVLLFVYGSRIATHKDTFRKTHSCDHSGFGTLEIVSRQTTLFGTVEERKLPSVYIGLAVTVL